MDYSVKSGSPEKQRSSCLVVGVYEKRKLTPAASRINEVSDGLINSITRRGDMDGSFGQTLLLHGVPGTLADRILLVGCGKERELSESKYRQLMATTWKALTQTGAVEAHLFLTELNLKGRDLYWKTRMCVEALEEAQYVFDTFKTGGRTEQSHLKRILIDVSSRKHLPNGEMAVKHGLAIAKGQSEAKTLANLPGNVCHPAYLEERARQLAAEYPSLQVEVVSQDELEQMGAGAFVAVAKGSEIPGRLIIMTYRGGRQDDAPIALVGKGITFDTGGISLKPGNAMDEMKFDMGGAASVFGTLKATCELELPINLVCLVAAAENMPDGKASRPGDIVKTLSGQTVEILNTDAEGRLVLCDALTYAERFKPQVVVDIATLTGACVIALGHIVSGLMSNHAGLAQDLLQAGEKAGDRAWRLPLLEEYEESLKSNFADFSNLGGRDAGAITAAAFLSKFTRKMKWAHLDIAGTAWKSGAQKGATGRPVPLLTQFLLERAEAAGDR